MNKEERQGLAWVIFHGIHWKRDIKDVFIGYLKKQFPHITEFLDERKYHTDIAKAHDREELIAQAIKTDFGKSRIAKAMLRK